MLAVVQVRDDNRLDWGDSHGGGEVRSDPLCILMVEPTRFSGRLEAEG